MTRFGFVVHPLFPSQRVLMAIRTLSPSLLAGAGSGTPVVARFPRVASPAGPAVDGIVRAAPLLPAAMLAEQEAAVERIAAAASALAADGASVVGLGALCAVVGSRGEEVARRVSVPVTTGVSYTAFAAARTLDRVAEALGETLAGRRVAIAGMPGALAVAVAELVARRGARVVLLDGPAKARERLAAKLRSLHERREPRAAGSGLPSAEVAADAASAAREADFLVGASSTGGALDPAWLRRGSVVIDVAEPRDLPRAEAHLPGRLVVDGENVSLPSSSRGGFGFWTAIYNWLIGQRHGIVYACFAEPIVLALEGKGESFSLGKEIPAEKAEEIGRLGEKHGFRVDRLFHAGAPIHRSRIEAVAKIRRETLA